MGQKLTTKIMFGLNLIPTDVQCYLMKISTKWISTSTFIPDSVSCLGKHLHVDSSYFYNVSVLCVVTSLQSDINIWGKNKGKKCATERSLQSCNYAV